MSKIEWTDETWQTKSAAKRIGVSVEDYIQHRKIGMGAIEILEESA